MNRYFIWTLCRYVDIFTGRTNSSLQTPPPVSHAPTPPPAHGTPSPASHGTPPPSQATPPPASQGTPPPPVQPQQSNGDHQTSKLVTSHVTNGNGKVEQPEPVKLAQL